MDYDFGDLKFLSAREKVVEEMIDYFSLKELLLSRQTEGHDASNARCRTVHTRRLSISTQASTDRAVFAAIQKIPKNEDVDPTLYVNCMQEIRSLKYIKGHPEAIHFVLSLLHQRSSLVRLTALQVLPELVRKGDREAIIAAVDRLKDWNAEVRHAAVASLQDSSGKENDRFYRKNLNWINGRNTCFENFASERSACSKRSCS